MENAVEKTKLCLSCEGAVSLGENQCTFCGTPFEEFSLSQDENQYKLVEPTNTNSPIPIPIYRPKKATPVLSPEDQLRNQVEAVSQGHEAHRAGPKEVSKRHVFESPFKKHQEVSAPQEPALAAPEEEHHAQPLDLPMRPAVFAMLGLISGSTLLLFSFILFLFGQDGILTVHWNSDTWPVLFVVSLVCLGFGIKCMRSLNQIK